MCIFMCINLYPQAHYSFSLSHSLLLLFSFTYIRLRCEIIKKRNFLITHRENSHFYSYFFSFIPSPLAMISRLQKKRKNPQRKHFLFCFLYFTFQTVSLTRCSLKELQFLLYFFFLLYIGLFLVNSSVAKIHFNAQHRMKAVCFEISNEFLI